MKVLILTADYPPHPWSGIGVAVERQAAGLAALGIEVEVLVADQPPPADAAGSTAPRSARRLPRVRRLPRDRFPLDPRGCDWVHVHSLRLAGLGLELRRRFGLPLAATVHGLPHLELAPSPLARRWSAVQRRLLLGADRVVLLSESERAAAVAWLPAIASRARVVPNAASPARPSPWPPLSSFAPPVAAPDRSPIVFAGRFAASKGLDLFADMAAVLAAGPGRHRFVLAGGHGDGAGTAAARWAARLPGCRLTGWLAPTEVGSLLRSAALVVVPSRYEPFGLVALDAMAAGAPVLAADVGGLREVAAAGSGGRRLAGSDPHRWAAEARRLLLSGEAEALGAAGPAWAARRFGPAATAARLATQVYGMAPPAAWAAGGA
jgi:glycogen(starch) synthase